MPKSDVEAWIAQWPEGHGRVLSHLRELILAAIPDVVEFINWSRPCYGTKSGSLICYLHASKSHVNLGFEKGTSLVDPDKLREGTGKNMRHIKFRHDQDIDDPAVSAMLGQALAIA